MVGQLWQNLARMVNNPHFSYCSLTQPWLKSDTPFIGERGSDMHECACAVCVYVCVHVFVRMCVCVWGGVHWHTHCGPCCSDTQAVWPNTGWWRRLWMSPEGPGKSRAWGGCGTAGCMRGSSDRQIDGVFMRSAPLTLSQYSPTAACSSWTPACLSLAHPRPPWLLLLQMISVNIYCSQCSPKVWVKTKEKHFLSN